MDLHISDLFWSILNILLVIAICILIVNLIRLPRSLKDITRRLDKIENRIKEPNDKEI